jgi:hypothetical protein
MSKEIPPKLFKYQPIASGSHTIDNLKNNQIWFSKPYLLNDPFDCAISLNINGTDEEFLEFYYVMVKMIPDPAAQEAASKLLANGKLNPSFKAHIIEYQLELSQRKVDDEFSQMGIACFSERIDSVLMWSHYAEGHKGLCLEFDTNYPPFQDREKLHQVVYSNSYPSVSPVAVIHDLHLPITPLITKSNDWNYEKEWRFIMANGNNLFQYTPNALTAIFFGCSMHDDDKKEIASILAKSSVHLYNMKRSITQFKLEVEPYTKYLLT